MKTVITSTGDNTTSKFDLRFGRAAYFCILDEDTKEVRFEENEYKDSKGGAGTKAGEKMIELKVNKVISGDFGPKAKEMLDKFNIQMVILQDSDSNIADIIQKL